MDLAQMYNNRTITVKLKRRDLITALLALDVVIKASDKDKIPNENVKLARMQLAQALAAFDKKNQMPGGAH